MYRIVNLTTQQDIHHSQSRYLPAGEYTKLSDLEQIQI